jgi:two-component system, NtrC family, response regulator AtoC
MPTVLIVEDEPTPRSFLSEILSGKGYGILEAGTLAEAQGQIDVGRPDIILLDIQLPDGSGMNLLERVALENPGMPVIMITGFGDIDLAVEAMQSGAQDFLTKPIDTNRLLKALTRASDVVSMRRELDHLRESRRSEYRWVVGETLAMKRVAEIVERAAPTQSSVLITGETGTGKEVIANAIHYLSQRRNEPFMAVNCSALPDQLLESELFGHEPQSFTGATKRKTGLMEVADGGTLFLDEIATMKPDLQAKILRALEERAIRRVGATASIKVDVRIIAASNKNLPDLIESGTFREDLYYRLNVITINLPALRERLDDIPALAGIFIKKFNMEMGKQVCGVSPRAIEALKTYRWPGNIRQLRNAIESALLFCDGDMLEAGHFPHEITGA